MVRRFKKLFTSNKFNQVQGKRRKRKVKCYHCNEGHVKDNCPKLKSKDKNKDTSTDKRPTQKTHKNLKATWDETSSESEIEAYAGITLMACHQEKEDEASSSAMNIESIDEGGTTSEESSSTGGVLDDEIDKFLRYGLVILFNVMMWGCYVNSLKALSSLQATVTNFAANFLTSGLAGFFLFKEPLPSQMHSVRS
ncbi:uncharacterized protein LOC122038423 isoform X2 [Zingiber officinale]|uniref:uncharacterized protein LOC122038423 isoform X2 n=1 Tax=Zingiber officinale TaxID=94328 RepID=UPI001C4CACA2|nr:uncharacterized protein LOC122038423 isoform X2 [Zingiber officinale]